jgi:hypothetical protein
VSASNHGIFFYFAPSAFDFQPFRASTLNSRFFVWVREVVLPQQVFPVVVSIRRSNDTVNVLLRRLVGIGCVLSQVRGALMIEFDQNDRALHAVVKDTVSF